MCPFVYQLSIDTSGCQRNSKTPKGQTEIDKSEDRQDHGQQNETKDKHRTHNTTLTTKAGVTRALKTRSSIYIFKRRNSTAAFMSDDVQQVYLL